MTCIYCTGPVELPERAMPAWCPACDATFYPIEEHGFFVYEITIYAPLDDERGGS